MNILRNEYLKRRYLSREPIISFTVVLDFIVVFHFFTVVFHFFIVVLHFLQCFNPSPPNETVEVSITSSLHLRLALVTGFFVFRLHQPLTLRFRH